MSAVGVLAGVAFGGLATFLLMRRWREAQRAAYIQGYTLPLGLYRSVRKHRPVLTDKDLQLVNRGLRQFFLAYLRGGQRYVSMPSQLADELWHEFILHTRAYGEFCQRAFGQMLHHTPATALGANRQHNAGLRRCFWQACRDELIDPRHPTRLPLLFALDGKIGIPDGFRYTLDCKLWGHGPHDGGNTPHCAGDFSDSSIDGGTDGFGDGDGDSGDGGGDGGDGGGCGGGCGGD